MTTIGPMSIAAMVGLLGSYLVSITLMPVVLRIAVLRKLLDFPDDVRRTHARPIPRLGGVAVFASVAVVATVGALFADRESLVRLLPFLGAIAAGSTILFATGLVDDIRGVRPIGKLSAQLIAALLVYAAGFRIDTITFASDHAIALGVLALPVTVLWTIGLSNAFNLVDGADGLAGGVAAIALVATAISAAVVHDPLVACCALILLGAMLGFLRFNFAPARIFLGDSGSLVVGFLLAVLTVKGATRADGTIQAIAPIFALSYPLLDTGISMLRRWLRGEPLSRADGRHIHHQLRALGIGPRQSVALIYALSAVIAVLGLSATFAPPQLTVAITVGGGALLVLIFAYGLRWLQYHEFVEAGASVASAPRAGRAIIRDKILARDAAALLASARTFDELVTMLQRSAPRFRFVHAELQGRSATRQFVEPIPVQVHGASTWKLEYPVTDHDSDIPYPIMLSIWCATSGTGTPAGAERVAKILAPAIAHWLATHWSDESVQRELAGRFPGVYTPAHGVPIITSDYSLREATAARPRQRHIS